MRPLVTMGERPLVTHEVWGGRGSATTVGLCVCVCVFVRMHET